MKNKTLLYDALRERRCFPLKHNTQHHRKEASDGASSLRAGYTEGQSLDTSCSLWQMAVQQRQLTSMHTPWDPSGVIRLTCLPRRSSQQCQPS